MSYDYSEKKITAIISDKLPVGLALNALGHLAFSAGRYGSDGMMGQEVIIDANNTSHIGLSKYPFIVLKADEEEIRSIIAKAKEKNIFTADYSQEMFDTGPDEDLVNALSKAKDIRYHAALLIGNSKEIKELTGHLKLYR